MRKAYVLGIPVREVVLLSVVVSLVLFYLTGTPLSLLLPPLVYGATEFLYRRYVNSVWEELPHFVHALSTSQRLTLSDVVKEGTKGYGNLSRELSYVERNVENGVPVERALRGMAERLGDKNIERVVETIIWAFRGGNTERLLKNLAEELYVTLEESRERRYTLSLTRYTVMLSAFLLVPLVLGMTENMVEEIGGSFPFSTVLTYLVLLSFITSLFLSLLEGGLNNLLPYLLLGTSSAVGVFLWLAW